MDSKKLSLPVLFDDDEREYETPCYLVTIQSRFASRVSDDIDTRAEAKALQDFLHAAVAQQAQPLTDEMIEAEAEHWWIPGEHRANAVRFAKWARDRMAHHAQPRKASGFCSAHQYPNEGERNYDPSCRICWSQQAQPKMPTREMIAAALNVSQQDWIAKIGPRLALEDCTRPNCLLHQADAVLALFAPKSLERQAMESIACERCDALGPCEHDSQ